MRRSVEHMEPTQPDAVDLALSAAVVSLERMALPSVDGYRWIRRVEPEYGAQSIRVRLTLELEA